MPKRSKERDLARDLFLQAKGKLSPKDIAEKLGVNPALVRKWKCDDKWEDLLKKPKRGAPKGNQYAKGHGAPKGNHNAEKHGAFSTPRMEFLTEEQQAEINSTELEFADNALRHLQSMLAKKADLENRIAKLEAEMGDEEKLYLDRVTVMDLPSGKMTYSSSSSAHSRWLALEQELGRTQGRISRLLDSIKSDQAETQRVQIERERLELARQKATGIFHLDDDSGELIPEDDEDELIDD